ncbi:UNVERIFIED_CONTAM: hypothetical protein FKN15_046715 [Acipenser sinensis]
MRLANTAGLLMAYLDGILRSAPLPESVASELHLLSGMLLQISGFQGQALDKRLAGLIVTHRQLWLSQARVPDADKSALLDTPISPGHTFGASSGGDIATLPLRAGGIATGACDAPFPCSSMGQDEALASTYDYGNPDSSDSHCAAWQPEVLPAGYRGS